MRQESGQTFCCLPWCGKSFSRVPSHSREFVVDGERVRLTYPALIDYHDIERRGQGGDREDLANQAPLCHDCHMAHHDGRNRLEFADHGHALPLSERRLYATDAQGHGGYCVFGDPDCEVA